MTEQHEAGLVHQYETRAEMWGCARCGYLVIIKWTPFRKIILVDGDLTASHTISKGGVQMQADIVDASLEPFYDWLRRMDE